MNLRICGFSHIFNVVMQLKLLEHLLLLVQGSQCLLSECKISLIIDGFVLESGLVRAGDSLEFTIGFLFDDMLVVLIEAHFNDILQLLLILVNPQVLQLLTTYILTSTTYSIVCCRLGLYLNRIVSRLIIVSNIDTLVAVGFAVFSVVILIQSGFSRLTHLQFIESKLSHLTLTLIFLLKLLIVELFLIILCI